MIVPMVERRLRIVNPKDIIRANLSVEAFDAFHATETKCSQQQP
jgi:hypothetical protein